MDIVTYKQLKLYTNQKNILQPITVKQEDGLSRYLKITLMSDENVVELLDTDSVIINVKRSDNQSQAFSGSISDGIITVPIPAWLMKKTGRSTCSVSCFRLLGYELSTDTEVDENKTYYTESGGVYTAVTPVGTEDPSALGWYEAQIAKLSSNAFYIDVQELEYDGEDISDDPNYNVLLNLIAQVQALEDAWQLLDPDGYVNQIVVNNNVVEFNNTDAGATIGELHFVTINGNDIVDENAAGDLQLFEKADIDTTLANPSDNTKVLSEKAVNDNFIAKTDIDTSMANPTSDSKVLSEKAIKTYVDDGLDTKANKDGSYPTMSVGEAESLKTSLGVLDKTPLSYQTVGGASDVTTGLQKLNKLVGCKIVKNNYMDEQVPDTLTLNGITVNLYANKFKINAGTSGGSAAAQTFKIIDVTANHIYFSTGCFLQLYVNNNWDSNLNNNSPSAWIPSFYTITKTGKVYCEIYIRANEEYSTKEYEFNPFIDLTQMFGSNAVVNAILGSGTDAQKYANLVSFLGGNLPTAYNTGSFSSCKSAKLKTVDYNQFDLSAFLDSIGDPINAVDNGHLTGKVIWNNTLNYTGRIGVIKNGIVRNGGSLGEVYVIFNYTDGTDSGYPNNSLLHYNDTIISADTKVVKNITLVYSNTGSYDFTNGKMCIFLYWDGSRIGYEPYAEHIVDLPNKDLNGILQVDGDGNVYADGDELTPDGSGNSKRYDVIDLGSLNWSRTQDYGVYRFSAQVSGGASPKSGGRAAICQKYVRGSDWNSLADKEMAFSSLFSVNSTIVIRDDSYSDAATFKTVMSSVYLIFEKATPEALTADTFSPNFYGDDFGTMQFLDENDNIIDGLQGNEIFYKANIAGFAESVYSKVNGDPNDLVVQSDLTSYTDKDTQLLNALSGTLRQCLCLAQSLNFDKTAVVDLNTLNWIAADNGFYAYLSTYKTGNVSHGLCTKYKLVNKTTVITLLDLEMAIDASGYVIAKDLTYSTASAFKESLKGVLLAYEKN